ncbi:hypothetical protein CU103_25945 [Phyllobacterium sophorae]|uniref:Uncharacterized protein n=1 Tax=Phyllobacterium sophorae TaxID=1520277 RepID=A0A2P7AY14_9HYPH|nr:hypothetical protein CU103_25945 [Phyllobacterium sophorae]
MAASRKPEGPDEFGPNPSGFGVVRWKGIGLAKSLDLVREFPPAELFNMTTTRSLEHERHANSFVALS